MTKIFNFKVDWLLWFLILAPTFYIAGTETRTAQLEFFKVSIIVLIALFHSNKWIGAFLLYTVFQFLFFKESPNFSAVVPNIFFAAVLYHFIMKYTVPCKKYLWVLYCVLIFNVLWIPFQMFQIDPVWVILNTNSLVNQTLQVEYSGWFALPAFLGNYASAVIPFSFVLSPFLFPVAIAGIFFSKSSFSAIAGLAASCFYFWFKKRIYFWIIIAVFGIASAFYILKYDFPTGQPSRRFNAWGLIIRESFKKQFLGHGIGTYTGKYVFIEASPSLHNAMLTNNKQFLDFLAQEASLNGKNELVSKIAQINPNDLVIQSGTLKNELQKNMMDYHIWDPAHNEFLQVFFEMGIIGVLIIGGYIFDLFRRFFIYGGDDVTLALMSSFVAIIIISFAHFPFHVARLSGPFISILALLDTRLLQGQYGDEA